MDFAIKTPFCQFRERLY